MFGNKAQICWPAAWVNIAFCVAGTAATAPGLDSWACTARPSLPYAGHNHATTMPLVRTMLTITRATVGQVSSKFFYKYSLSSSRDFFFFPSDTIKGWSSITSKVLYGLVFTWASLIIRQSPLGKLLACPAKNWFPCTAEVGKTKGTGIMVQREVINPSWKPSPSYLILQTMWYLHHCCSWPWF